MKLENIEKVSQCKLELDELLRHRKKWAEQPLDDTNIVWALAKTEAVKELPLYKDEAMQAALVMAIVGEYNVRIEQKKLDLANLGVEI